MAPRFDRFAKDLTFADLPADVLWTLRRSFVDTMGVAIFAATTDMSDIARRAALAGFGASGPAQPRMLQDGRRTSPVGAAMAGAFTIDSVDAHDGTTPNKGHAGSAIFPALLALADTDEIRQTGLSGPGFATWLALAYEVSYRAGQVQHATVPDYHTSGSWTATGVATASARALGCGTDQIRHAAGIGEYHGPRSQMMRCIDHPTMLRDGVGWGAPSGIAAAYLAREGFTGAPALTCEGPEADPFWEDLGETWLMTGHTHYKKYPCCRWAHPSMDSVRDLMRDNDLHHGQIARVEIRTFHYATRLAGHAPATQDELAYSIAFPVAAMIVRGAFGPDELDPATLTDPDILRVSKVTDLVDDPDLTAQSTGKRWAAVSLELTDGRRIEAAPRTPRGDPDDPLSDREITEKFHQFADPILGHARAGEIRSLCESFDSLDADAFAHLLDLLLTAPA